MIQIKLRPEIQAQLEAHARAHGIEVPAYIETLIEQAVKNGAVRPRKRTQKDMEQFFEAMSANSEKIPQLPDRAFTRESFYQDHD